jgi:hypothetical protein
MGGRFTRLKIFLATSVLSGGLVVIGSASALPTNNYTGPRNCADVEAEYGLDFNCTPGATTQSSAGGVNLFEASGNGGTVTQTNTTGPNIAKCVLDSGVVGGQNANTAQSCNFVQDTDPGTGDNTIIAELRATQSFSDSVGIQPLSQTINQALSAVQTSASGTNTVRGPNTASAALLRSSQTLNSNINADVPPSQAQERRLLIDVDQVASTSGSNWIDFNLDSSQTANSESVLAGTQNQDTIDSNGAADDPNARAWIYQRTGSGNNYTKGRGTDNKVENAQSTFTGATQNQWHSGGGFDIVADVDDVSGSGTVDLGTPYADGTDCTAVDGFRKLGTITTEQGLPGTQGVATTAGTRSQNDKLPIGIPGTSPDDSTVAACSKLTGPANTFQKADISVDGHADNAIVGAIAASLVSGGTTAAYVPFNDQTVHVNLDCTRNAPNTCGTTGGGVTGSGTDVSAVEDVQFTAEVASFTNADPSKPVASAEISWGDGTDPSAGNVSQSGGTGNVTGTHTYANPGTYAIDTTLRYADNSVAATMSSTATVADVIEGQYLAAGSFAVSDAKAVANAPVTFWGDGWAAANPFTSGKIAPSAFKGFENTINNPTCSSGTWQTKTGNSPPPPAGSLPRYMYVIVASKVIAAKSTPTGDIVHIGVVDTLGTTYGPSPSQTGTGKFLGFVC